MSDHQLFFRRMLPALLWSVIILIICGFPGDKIPELSFLEWLKPDKIIHLILFGVQSYLLLLGFTRQISFQKLKKNAVLFALLISIFYGGFIEVLQDYVFINRNGDFRDFAANTVGALIGFWIFKRYHSLNKQANIKLP